MDNTHRDTHTYIYNVGWILGSSVLCSSSKYWCRDGERIQCFSRETASRWPCSLLHWGIKTTFQMWDLFHSSFSPKSADGFWCSFCCPSLYFRTAFIIFSAYLLSWLPCTMLLSRHTWSFSNAEIIIVRSASDAGFAIIVILAAPHSTQKYQSFFWTYSSLWSCHSCYGEVKPENVWTQASDFKVTIYLI